MGAKEKEEKEGKTEEKKATGCNNQEIVAVLGHELGHWKMNHVLKNILIAQVQIFSLFALFGYLSKSSSLSGIWLHRLSTSLDWSDDSDAIYHSSLLCPCRLPHVCPQPAL